jgi:hypothetical protein
MVQLRIVLVSWLSFCSSATYPQSVDPAYFSTEVSTMSKNDSPPTSRNSPSNASDILKSNSASASSKVLSGLPARGGGGAYC